MKARLSLSKCISTLSPSRIPRLNSPMRMTNLNYLFKDIIPLMPLDDYKDYNSKRPPKVDPKYKKEFLGSLGGQAHTHKVHEEWYESESGTTNEKDTEDVPNEEKTTTKKMGGKTHTTTEYKKSYNPQDKTIHEDTREETPNQRKENFSFKNKRQVKQEFSETYYDEGRKTVNERHGVNEEISPEININRTKRNGRVLTEELTEKLYDAETGANINLHEVSEDFTSDRNVDYEIKSGRLIKKITNEKSFDSNANRWNNNHVTEEYPTIERNEEIHSLDGFVYGREITETSYDPKENVQLTRHGIDWNRLGCGHTMQKGATFYKCSVCGKTLCDDCGANINGSIFCNAHVLNARLLHR